MSASKSHRHDGNDFVNRWDFRCRRNDDRVDAAVTLGCRLFQALVPEMLSRPGSPRPRPDQDQTGRDQDQDQDQTDRDQDQDQGGRDQDEMTSRVETKTNTPETETFAVLVTTSTHKQFSFINN